MTTNHSGRLGLTVTVLGCTLLARAQSMPRPGDGWPTYGGDQGGQRYSTAAQINKANVTNLQPVWTFHTGLLTGPHRVAAQVSSFETTPVLFNGSLYLTSAFDQVFALDAATGSRKWSYDPEIDDTRRLGTTTSRGVAVWSSGSLARAGGDCADRILFGTLDARLIALDAATGKPCADFGQGGSIDLTQGVDYRKGDDYSITSPPTVIGDVVVIGSGIEDNVHVDAERGDVRGYDVRTGALLWTWEPMPWANQQKLRTGAGNTWSVIAADPEHGLVYLPTSSPSPDHYGGMRPGDDRDADSIVALDAKTGRKVWAFQVVHHNLWDYDIAAEPLLFTFRGSTPAVAISTKMGMLFVLNRLTGEPLYPVTERPVPQSDVPGEVTSPTQPFQDLPPLAPLALDMSQPLGITPADDTVCRNIISHMSYHGIYTPPSFQGTVMYPGPVGGVNWGSAALDPTTGVLYANTNRLPYSLRLKARPHLPPRLEERLIEAAVLVLVLIFAAIAWGLKGRAGLAWAVVLLLVLAAGVYANKHRLMIQLTRFSWFDTGTAFAAHFGREVGDDTGTPYILLRQPVVSRPNYPCSPTPWGTLSAVNLNTGQTVFQTALGTMVTGQQTGTINFGGPIITAGGLVFTAASMERYLRAFDSATGKELWKGALPATAQATPMTYTVDGRQYVVVAAGGHAAFGPADSDTVVAFALP